MKYLAEATAGILIIAIGVVVATQIGLFSDPCDEPLSYRLGTFDDQFSLPSSTARELLADAEAVWERELDRELFVYEPTGDLAVNFIFDSRQQRTNTANEIESELDDLRSSHEEIASRFEQIVSNYQDRLTAYEADRRSYQNRLADYNNRVENYNEQGGASPSVQEELAEEKSELERQQADLEQRRLTLEALQQDIEQLAVEGNSLAQAYNEKADTYQDRFGTNQEFNQATYVDGDINVYQFEGEDDLRLALAHELGHALGIEHVSESQSLMYPLMEDQPLNNLTLSAEDKAALSRLCQS